MNHDFDIKTCVAVLAPEYGGEDFEDHSAIRQAIHHKIMTLYLKGYSNYFCGCQQGFPLLVADTVNMIKDRYPLFDITLNCIVRSPHQFLDYDPFYRNLAESILSDSTEFQFLEQHEFAGGDIVQNEELLNRASLILTCYDPADPDEWVLETLLPKIKERTMINLFVGNEVICH